MKINDDTKNKIKLLRNLGYSYRKIASILGISKSTAEYYSDKKYQEYAKLYHKKRPKKHPYSTKLSSFKFIGNSKLSTKKSRQTPAKRLLQQKIYRFLHGDNMSITVNKIIEKFGENPKCYLTGEQIDIYNTY